jgi:hypothetical protein
MMKYGMPIMMNRVCHQQFDKFLLKLLLRLMYRAAAEIRVFIPYLQNGLFMVLCRTAYTLD